MTEVQAVHKWKSNAELIYDVAALGYLRKEWWTLDPTYGHGTFWKLWRPDFLLGSDLDPALCHLAPPDDFTALRWEDQVFDAVVFDPPYKLNGRPDPLVDKRYGVDGRVSWQDRLTLIALGTVECARVCSGNLLVKCMDQVCSGQMHWQTDIVTRLAEASGFRKVDRFDMVGKARKQPDGRRQVHARGRGSTLLVFSRV